MSSLPGEMYQMLQDVCHEDGEGRVHLNLEHKSIDVVPVRREALRGGRCQVCIAPHGRSQLILQVAEQLVDRLHPALRVEDSDRAPFPLKSLHDRRR